MTSRPLSVKVHQHLLYHYHLQKVTHQVIITHHLHCLRVVIAAFYWLFNHNEHNKRLATTSMAITLH